ncbi:MAG: hypothetical protein LBG17_03070 [Bacteroidales bacterium]|jgi:hypothetical protein|nr:hypothetical protein [Bacteroidales bacterium]
MKIPVSIAESLILLRSGEKIPASKMKHGIVDEMLDNGILKKQIRGRSKSLMYIPEKQVLDVFLQNHYGISDLQNYIKVLTTEELNRADAIAASSDSKLKKVRTFKGFLVNCYNPVQVKINGKEATLNPNEGAFQFIYDFEHFEIPQEITVVGIENPENFRHIDKQKYLFEHIKPLFVSRYPQNQSKDLIKWIQSISNPYLHFGDFDFAGIGIYLNEYKKYLGGKAMFFIPENIGYSISKYGNKELYDRQRNSFGKKEVAEVKLLELLKTIDNLKKGLEQEIFMRWR